MDDIHLTEDLYPVGRRTFDPSSISTFCGARCDFEGMNVMFPNEQEIHDVIGGITVSHATCDACILLKFAKEAQR